MSLQTCRLDELPKYLQDVFTDTTSSSLNPLTDEQIAALPTRAQQHAYLLLRRHILTEQISASRVLHPPTILQRALTYEALGFPDLAAADAYIAYTLCDTVCSDEWVSDLEPSELSGEPFPVSENTADALSVLVDALVVLIRCLNELGATRDADLKAEELTQRLAELEKDPGRAPHPSVRSDQVVRLFPGTESDTSRVSSSRFGLGRREVYPWNQHEPDRNSLASLEEINTILQGVAPELEAKITVLPALDGQGTWRQLGLFARIELPVEAVVLHEKSLLTGIRPLNDALCDACGADLEGIPPGDMVECPGEECDVAFCSRDCATRAAKEYHQPNLSTGHSEVEDEHDGLAGDEMEGQESSTSSTAPFCGNSALHEIGRTSSTDTAEWDLYFLLLTRTVQMSTTQSMHPLDLPTIKYLWGDFTSPPVFTESTSKVNTNTGADTETDTNTSISPPPKTLPFSLYHNIALPLQYFEMLMECLPDTHRPYTLHWLQHYDFWILQTLLAKFRGVANAQQSTYDGKAEIAAVHPMWCLANHSCAPNVTWTPTGVREFRVIGQDVVCSSVTPASAVTGEMDLREKETDGVEVSGKTPARNGIKKGDEIWSHYTDVRLPVAERQERLKEVLGGACKCVRCVAEQKEAR